MTDCDAAEVTEAELALMVDQYAAGEAAQYRARLVAAAEEADAALRAAVALAGDGQPATARLMVAEYHTRRAAALAAAGDPGTIARAVLARDRAAVDRAKRAVRARARRTVERVTADGADLG
jgi:hypothetical protein